MGKLLMLALLSAAGMEIKPEPGELPLSLDDAVALALRENYDLRVANLQRVAQRFNLLAARDKFNPHVSLQGAMGASTANRPVTVQTATGQVMSLAPHAEILLPTGTLLAADLQENFLQPPSLGTAPLNASMQLTLTQPLIRNLGPEVNRASVDTAELQERINKLTLKKTLIGTVARVVFAYRTFTQARVLVHIARNAVQRSRDILEINHQMVAAGRIAPAELVQVESQIATREVNAVTAENDFVAAQVTLLELLALDPEAPVAPVTEPVSEVPTPRRDAARALALANRPEYLAALMGAEVANKNLLLAENARKWDLSLTAQYRRGGVQGHVSEVFVSPITGPAQSLFVGLTLAVPLLDVLLQQQVVQAQVDAGVAKIGIAQLSNSILLDVDAACRTLDLRRRHLTLARRARELAQQTVDNEREKLSAGRSSNFQVLRFVDDLVNAEINELQTSIAYLNAVTTLQVQQGTLLNRWQVSVD